MSRSSARRLPLTIFIVAAAVRLLVGTTLWTLPLVRTPKLDSAEYLAWAQRLAAGDWVWPAVAQHAPGYPIFLAVLLALTGGSLTAALVCQALLGACTAALVGVIARRLAGDRAGWLAGIAYAIYGPAVYVETAVLAEGLLLFLLALALWALSDAQLSAGRAVLAGAAFGAATVVRPTALVIALACLAWLWSAKLLTPVARAFRPAERPPSSPEGLRYFALQRVGAFLVAFLVILFPSLLKNWTTSQTISLQGYGGLNVYIGNSPLHDGRATFRLGAGWDALNSEAQRAGITDATAQDRYYLRKTAREIAGHPAAFVKLLASKALWMIQSEEARDSHSYYFFAEQSPLLRILPRWIVLFPLAVVGMVVAARLKPSRSTESAAPAVGARRLQPSVTLVLFYTLSAALTVILLVVGLRYRMPLVPALAIAAGIGAEAIVSAARLRRFAELGMYAVAAAGAIAAASLLSDPRNRNTAEEWAFTGSALITERDLTAAEAAYRRAIDLDPRSGLAWDGLGLTMYNAGRLADAKTALDRAIAIDPDNSRAIFHLALVDERAGRMRIAADGYERALALSPYDADVASHLGDARRSIAVELGMAGRTREARDEMRRAVDANPANGEAWLDLCLLSIDLRDLDAAADALQRARQHGANPERAAFAADALAKARR